MKYEILNRFSRDVQFTAEIECEADSSISVKMGLAVLWAIKSRANLYGADLYGANMYGANLYGADLYGANMSRANLYGANLSGADLSRADLSRADLYGANMSGANMSGADLSGADLYGANMSGANLYGADLYGANMSRANLSGAKSAELTIARARILPEGALIGWKKCKDGVIVKLRIPENAKRSHAFGRKCRAEFAEVIEVFGAEYGVSSYDGKTEYRVGDTVYPDKFSEEWQVECESGIHFFITRIEAENY